MIQRYSSWIWLVGALAVIAIVSVLATPASAPPPLSIRNAHPDGGLAAYLWLDRIRRPVTVDHNLSIRSLAPNGVLLMLTPQPTLSRDQARALLGWIGRGGRLVLATEDDSATSLTHALGLDVVAAPEAPVQVVQPLLEAPPVARLGGNAAGVVTGAPAGATVASSPVGTVLLYRPVGLGAVWMLTARSLLDNAHLHRAENRRLLLNLVGQGRSITFEEYEPNVSSGSGWLTSSTWGAATIFAAVTLTLYLWLSGWRLGPPLPAPEERTRTTQEYVTSLAGLLHQTHNRGDVLRMYQDELQRAIAEHAGSIEDLTQSDRATVQHLLEPAANLSEEGLRDRVAAIVEYEQDMGRERV